MVWFFRAVAFDLDGTLAVADQLTGEVLSAIDDARRDRAMLLVTGRTERDLVRVFPGLVDHFDAVVTENGAVLTRPGHPADSKRLHERVDPAVDRALAGRGVAIERGQVLVAIDGRDAVAATEVIAELGLDHQVLRNRGAAMILPAGVTKGTGLSAGLGLLGLSAHNAVAVGDAENDLTLLRTAEVGVAVANAVPSLIEHADLVLEQPNGAGVASLLGGPLLAGRAHAWSTRRRVTVGTFQDGSPVTIPGSQASVLITGRSGAGKSYLAGLLAERWIDAGYSVLVIDPEGDHLGLAERPDVRLVAGAFGLPSPHDLLALFHSHPTTVVLDLSGLDDRAQLGYRQRLPSAIAAERASHGTPHWVIDDEAHQYAQLERSIQRPTGAGSCLVTWRPELLDAESTTSADVVINAGRTPIGSTYAEQPALHFQGTTRRFTVGHRGCGHVRHQHKYATAQLPPSRSFYFDDRDPSTATTPAATLEEFCHLLGQVDLATVHYHASRGDFSRWVQGTIGDRALGQELAHIERDLAIRQAAAIEHARQHIREVVKQRYLGA